MEHLIAMKVWRSEAAADILARLLCQAASLTSVELRLALHHEKVESLQDRVFDGASVVKANHEQFERIKKSIRLATDTSWHYELNFLRVLFTRMEGLSLRLFFQD